jgi:hypothetical protein
MSASAVAQNPSPMQAIRALRHLFAHQGTIVASWRTYNGRKLGPYYRLAYRAEGRQRSLYLGKSKNLLRHVRRLLEKLQNPLKTRRILHQAQKAAQADLKRHMAQFRIDLLRVGLQLRGYAARGWRRFRALRRTGCQPVRKCETGCQSVLQCPPHAPPQHDGILRKLSCRLRETHLLQLTSPSTPLTTAPNTPNCPLAAPVDQIVI